jgi:protein N-lysine methyltransferase METTL21C
MSAELPLEHLFAAGSDGQEFDSDGEPMGVLEQFFASTEAEPETAAGHDESAAESDDLLQIESPLLAAPIVVQQKRRQGIAHQLWPAATFLCRYLEQNIHVLTESGKPLCDITAIELGAGLGLTGLFAAGLGLGSVILTDLADVCPQLRANAALNPSIAARVTAQPLQWGSADVHNPAFAACDVILAADCVYWEELFAPLVDTLFHLTASGAPVLMAHVRRWKRDAKFFKLCQKRLHVEKLYEEVTHAFDPQAPDLGTQRQVMRIYRITRLPSTAAVAAANVAPAAAFVVVAAAAVVVTPPN